MLDQKDIDKLNKTPEKLDKLISNVFASNEIDKILELFSSGNNIFFDYLIKKNYIVYFDTYEVRPLINNYDFISYLYKTDKDLFQKILECYDNNVLNKFVQKNIYDLINDSIYLYDKKNILKDVNIAKILLDNTKNKGELQDLINNIEDNYLIKLIINKIINLNIILDVDNLNIELLHNIDVALYLVFNVKYENISYIKGDAYQKVIFELAKKITNNEIDLSMYDSITLPLDFIHKTVLDAISFNKEYYYLLKYFPEHLFDEKIDYKIMINSDTSKKEEIINKYKTNNVFFKLFISNIEDNDYKYLDVFDIEKMDNAILDLVNEYKRGNECIRKYLLTSDKLNNNLLIYETIINKEQPIVLKEYLKRIDASKCNYNVLEQIYNLLRDKTIGVFDLNDSFYSSNIFLNINLGKGLLLDVNRFKSLAFINTYKYKNELELIKELDKSDNVVLNAYELSYLVNNDKDNIKKYERKLYSNITNNLTKKDKELIIYLIENEKRNPLSIKYIQDEKDMYVFLNFGNILNTNTSEYIKCLNFKQIACINIKHIRTIYNMLLNYLNEEDVLKIAINIYLLLGFEISIDLLNNKYGNISDNVLKHMFNKVNISDVTFMMDGNKYEPIINKELISIIFGDNYKLDNTPIKFYLNNYQTKRNISEEYINSVKLFFNVNFGISFEKWNLIKEEYVRKQSNSKLDTRLNIKTINDLINYINKIRPLLTNSSDIALKNSDVMKYAGIDNQYVLDYKLVPSRIVTLSRNMDKVKNKTIPDIELSLDNLHLKTLHPQDRNMLSLGYKSGDCFRPMGVADNFGNGASILEYVTSTKYATCIQISDENDNFIAFTPVYRNGNVLLINSIEGPTLDNGLVIKIYKLLSMYANEVINITNSNNDSINYVLITSDGNNFKKEIMPLKIDDSFKFHLYDPTYRYSYAKLNNDQYFFEGNTDIHNMKYNYETKSYEYNNSLKDYQEISLDKNEYAFINKLLDIKNKIILESNKRFRTEDVNKQYVLIEEIQLLKKDYLSLLNEYAKRFNINNYDTYQVLVKIITNFDDKISSKVSKAYFNDHYYVIKHDDDSIVFNYDKDYKDDCMKVLNALEREVVHEIIRKDF